jgi:hypothetical protein
MPFSVDGYNQIMHDLGGFSLTESVLATQLRETQPWPTPVNSGRVKTMARETITEEDLAALIRSTAEAASAYMRGVSANIWRSSSQPTTSR